MSASAIKAIIVAFLAFAVVGCNDDQPDPHLMDLAQQVVVAFHVAAQTKVRFSTATKKDITFTILYPGLPANGQADATTLIRAMIRKLIADGQQPHDQEINIWFGVTSPNRAASAKAVIGSNPTSAALTEQTTTRNLIL